MSAHAGTHARVAPRGARVAHPAVATRRPAARLLALAVPLVLVLAACGVRLESDPPLPLVPGASEIARQAAVQDAEDLQRLAAQVLADGVAGDADASAASAVPALLQAVADSSRAHEDALGGPYVPFPDADPTATPSTPSPTQSPASDDAPGVEDVVGALTEAAAAARAAVPEVDDGDLARLLASVATSRTLLADALAAVAGLPPAATDEPTAGAPGEGAGAGLVPQLVPDGITQPAALAIIASEDAAGLAWEVTAARADDGDAFAALRAQQHRDRADAWAAAATVRGTGLDPRRVSYALPTAVTDPAAPPEDRDAALADLEDGLAARYAAVVAAATPAARGEAVAALLDASRASVRLTGVLPAFPGAPELEPPA